MVVSLRLLQAIAGFIATLIIIIVIGQDIGELVDTVLKDSEVDVSDIVAKAFLNKESVPEEVVEPMPDMSFGSIGEPDVSLDTVSLCMIVKDEEKYLDGCLRSVCNHVDEIIIVDTGSTDKTVEIAKKYTDKIYFHKWENNFSKARNYSLSYATKDWILILDADEEMVAPVDLSKSHLFPKEVDAIFMSVESAFDNGLNTSVGNSIRMFRNNDGFSYDGIVHNTLRKGTHKVNALLSQGKLIHHGYNDPDTKHKKYDRTVALLKEQIKETPDDPVPWHYLTNSYLSIRSMDKECVESGLKAEELFKKEGKGDKNIRLHNYYNLSVAYMRMNKFQESEKWSLELLSAHNAYLDGFGLLSDIYMATLQLEKCICYSEKYVTLLEAYQKDTRGQKDVVYNTIGYSFKIHINAAIAYKLMGDMVNCNKHIKVLLSEERTQNLMDKFVTYWFFHSQLKMPKGEKWKTN